MSETIVKIKELTKKYENRAVVDHISLEIKEGEIFGLLGPNLRSKCILVFMIFAPVLVISMLTNVFDAMMAIDYSIKPFVTGYRMAENRKYENIIGSHRTQLAVYYLTGKR